MQSHTVKLHRAQGILNGQHEFRPKVHLQTVLVYFCQFCNIAGKLRFMTIGLLNLELVLLRSPFSRRLRGKSLPWSR